MFCINVTFPEKIYFKQFQLFIYSLKILERGWASGICFVIDSLDRFN